MSYTFKHIATKNISCIDTTYLISEFINKFFFFLTILDNSLFSILDDFFFGDDTY